MPGSENAGAAGRSARLPLRSAERARLTEVIERGTGPAAVVLVGDPGAGKSSLLAFASALARRRGLHVVAVPETDDGPSGVDAELHHRIRTAARRRSVVVVVDDAHQVHPSTLDALVSLNRALVDERVVLLFAAPADAVPAQLATLPVCRVEALSAADAAILLDCQQDPPTGWLRSEILRRVGGNPAAVLDFAAWARPSEPRALTVPPRFLDAYAERTAALPAATVRLLLLVAAADGHDDLRNVLTAARAELSDCEPAELSGLLTVTADRVTFQDPALLLACYHGAPAATRRAAHAALAAVVTHDTERNAWHQAHSIRTGEQAVALFEAAGHRSAQGGRHAEAAGALELAGLNSTQPHNAAHCFAQAAIEAARAGQLQWCRDLAQQVTELSDDPNVVGPALTAAGRHLALAGGASGFPEQVHKLTSTTGTAPEVAVDLVSAAVVHTLTEGDHASRTALARIAADAGALHRATASADAYRTGTAESVEWFRAAKAVLVSAAVTAGRAVPDTDCADVLLPGDGDSEVIRLVALGSAAWAGEDVAVAVRHLRRARQLLRDDDAAAAYPLVHVLLADALVEHGQWQDAAQVHAEALHVAALGRLPVLAAATSVQIRALRQLRGDSGRLPAWPTGPAADHRLVRALVVYASGHALAATGDRVRACDRFLEMFEPDGEPVHFGWTNRAIVALARTATTAEQRQAAARIVGIVRRAEDPGSSRIRELAIERATALLAGPDADDAESALHAATTNPLLADRPYDQATALLDQADRLRARRRFVAARPLLASAQELFARLGAKRDEEATRARLRATGVATHVSAADGFAALTAQQQHIATLAASGLSNRVIADRLALSPRTIGSHLYQIYPKLGVASRHQLSDVIPGPA